MRRPLLLLVLALILFGGIWPDVDALAADTRCGVDTDLNGSIDYLCTTTGDQDRDGEPDSTDAAATDWQVYPGVGGITSGCAAGQTRIYKADGTLTACTATCYCDADVGGTCYYVNPSAANDSGAGDCAHPFKTYLHFVHKYDGTVTLPSPVISLVPGDRVILRNGTYSTTYTDGALGAKAFFIKTAPSGTSAAHIGLECYPGETCTFSGIGTRLAPIQQVFLHNVNYWDIHGLTVTGNGCGGSDSGNAGCLDLSNAHNIGVWNNKIYNNDGQVVTNLAGILLESDGTGCDGTDVHHNLVYDNYDHTDVTDNRDNNMNIAVFRGRGIQLRYNRTIYSPTPHGINIRIKHADDQGTGNEYVSLIGNVMVGGGQGYSLHSAIAVFARNNISDLTWKLHNIGGPTNFRGNTDIQQNTWIVTGTAGEASVVEYLDQNSDNSDATGGSCNHCAPFGTFTFAKNVVVDGSGAYTAGATSTMSVARYATDAEYSLVVPAKLSLNNNGYRFTGGAAYALQLYKSTTCENDNFTGTVPTTCNTKGDSYTSLGGAQGAGYETSTITTVSALNVDNVCTDATCTSGAWGWAAPGTTTTSTTTTTTSTTSTVAAGGPGAGRRAIGAKHEKIYQR